MRSAGGWLAFMFTVVLAAPAPARAGACCMTAGIFGVGRLAIWEESAIGSRFSGAASLGAWDAAGVWQPNPAGYVDDELRLETYGLLRLSERGQVFASVPLLMNVRGIDEMAAGGGLGDFSLGVRYEAVMIGEYLELPAIGFTLSMLGPSGMRAEEAKQPFGVDATGRGAFGLSGALSLEQLFGKVYTRADLGGTLYSPFQRIDLQKQQQYGPTLAGSLSVGGEPLERVVIGGVLSLTHDLPIAINGEELPSSASTLGSAGLVASWGFPGGHWSLLGSAMTGAFIDTLGQNRPGRVVASVGVRYGVF